MVDGLSEVKESTLRSRVTTAHVAYIILFLVLFFLVIVPLIILLWGSVRTGRIGIPGDSEFTITNYVTAYQNPRNIGAILNSFVFAGGSTVVTIVIAVLMAWSVERTNMPCSSLVFTLMLVPMAMPGMLFSMAWILLLSPEIGWLNVLIRDALGFLAVDLESGPFNVYTMTGMIVVDGIRSVPTIFLLLAAAFRSMDPAAEEAAVMSGSGIIETFRRVTVRLLAPAILGGTLYVFMGTIDSFELPAMIGLPAGIYVFSTRIYWAATVQVPPNYGLANAFAVTFILLSIVLLWLYRRVTQNTDAFATVTGKGYRPNVLELGRWRFLPLALFAVYFLFAIVLPFIILAWASLQSFFQIPSLAGISTLSLDNYRTLLQRQNVRDATWNTIVLMVASSTLTMLLSFATSWVSLRTRLRGRATLDTMAFLPHITPGIVLGLALIMLFLGPLRFIPIYGTITILVIAYASKYVAFGTRTANAALIQIHRELEEAAYMSGGTPLRTFRTVVFPLILPAFLNGWLWVAVHAMRELSASLMLFSEQNAVLGPRLWFMWGAGQVGEASALGVLMMIGVVGLTFAARAVAVRMGR